MQLKWYMQYRQQKATIWTKKENPANMHWIECVLVILNVYIVSWWIENIWIFTLIPERPMTVFSQYHFFKTRMQIYIYLYESCMRENWFAFTLGLKYFVVQSIVHLVILGNWSTRVWIKVYLHGFCKRNKTALSHMFIHFNTITVKMGIEIPEWRQISIEA